MYVSEIGFASFGRRDVEDLACFVESEAGGREGGGTVLLGCSGEFLDGIVR